MNIFQAITSVITNPATIAVVVLSLAAWAGFSAFRLFRAVGRLTTALAEGRQALFQASTPLDFRQRYESIRRRLLAIPVLKSRWRDFSDSLIVPRESGRPLHSTIRPTQWFNLGLLGSKEVGLDTRYHAALPNLLVGAGLLFTFLGLAVALSSAGDIVGGKPKTHAAAAAPTGGAETTPSANVKESAANPGDEAKQQQEARSDALRKLLDTASFKFITSLAGLLLSISYTLVYKKRLRRVEEALELFVDAIEERIPPITAVSLQQEANALLERQLTFSESLANDISMSMQQVFDQAFDQRLGEHIKPLREAMETLARRLSGSNEDAIKTMMDSFLSRLQGGAGDRMQEVATSLEGLGKSLEGLQAGLGEAAARMAESADTMARRMGEGAEAALTRVTDQMGGVAETLREVAEQTRGAGLEAGKELARQLGAAASGFEAASREIASGLSRAAEGLEAKMGEQAQASAERLNGQFEAMVAQLQRLAESSRTTGAEALQAVADKVGASAEAFETMAGRISATFDDTAARTGGAFGKGAEDAVQRIAAATEGMRAELAALIADLRVSAVAAGETMRNGGAEGAGLIKEAMGEAGATVGASLTQAAGALASAGEHAGASLRRGGDDAATRLAEAGGVFGGRANDLGTQVEALTRTTEDVVRRLVEFNTAARDAATPLATVSTDLKAVSNALRDTTKPLATSAETVGRAIEQLSGAMQRLETTQTKAGQLADGVRGAAERFSGVDRELANVVSEMQKGLQGFAQEVSRCVRETDGQLARAVNQLQGLLSDLQSTIEDLGPLNPRPRGKPEGGN